MQWLWILLPVLAAAFFARSEYEKRHPEVTRYEFSSDELPAEFSGFRILFLTDMHSVSFGKNNQRLIDMILAEKPDLILYGGDMVTVRKGRKVDFQAFSELLRGAAGIDSLFALGNHESRLFEAPGLSRERDRFLSLLGEYGIPLLDNASSDVRRGDGLIRVSGLTMTKELGKRGRKQPLPEGFLRERLGDPSPFQILLFHTPLYLRETAEWGADITLSGHFHGGTIRLPLLGGVMTPQLQFFYPYCRGRFDISGKTAVVSGGLGTHSIPIRFLNRPEPVLIRLTGKDMA